jgi:hypothetical protein
MNPRVTLGFVAAVVILAALVFGLDKFNVGQGQAQANATATSAAGEELQIFQFDDKQVNAFEIHMGDKSARVEKQDDNWTVAGTGDPANKSSFTSLIIRMSQLKGTRRVEGASDLSQFGLAPPRQTATAQLADGSKFELDLGNATPVATGTYAKKFDAADVFVVPTQFSSDLERLVNDPKEPPTPTPRPATPTPAVSPEPEATATPSP